MTETELVMKLPTSVLKDQAESMAGSLYNFLLLHLDILYLVIGIIILFFIIRFLKNFIFSKRAKRNIPISTNKWFDWKEFEKWEEDQK